MSMLDNKQIKYCDKYKFVGDDVLKRVLLHEFKISDNLSNSYRTMHELFARWKNSESGKWCMEHAYDIEYRRVSDFLADVDRIKIIGYMSEKDYTWLLLNK